MRGGLGEERLGDEAVVEDNIGLAERLEPLDRNEVRVAGAGTHQVDKTAHRNLASIACSASWCLPAVSSAGISDSKTSSQNRCRSW